MKSATPEDALHRLAAELGLRLDPDLPALETLARLAYCAWWRDDREEIRARVGFEGPVAEIGEGPRAAALRWLAGEGPAVDRLEARPRWAERLAG
jgi:hypothetical protein